jgi:hypothetical protein
VGRARRRTGNSPQARFVSFPSFLSLFLSDPPSPSSQAFGRALQQITPHLTREQGFISDFLHITTLDASITFADYMTLETFFRRGASSYMAVQAQQGKLRDIRSAMEVVFGWLEGEIRDWIEGVLQRDSMCVLLLVPFSSSSDSKLMKREGEQANRRYPRRPRSVHSPW